MILLYYIYTIYRFFDTFFVIEEELVRIPSIFKFQGKHWQRYKQYD